jgi:formate hydrogenlyase subunit 4
MNPGSLFPLLLAMVLAPLLHGVINRTKAVAAGRVGQPLVQPYRDLWKLLQKGAVYSQTTTWVFRVGPVVGLASMICAIALLPFGAFHALASFTGDLVMAAYLLAVARFFTVLAALDTGSSFEAMGASREVTFSALAEPALFLGFAALARQTGSLSLTSMLGSISAAMWMRAAPALGLTIASMGVVFLAENARIPVDDPTTHLELTMIHEVMVLDHSGPDFAMIQYTAALKMWLLGAIIVAIAIPWHSGNPIFDGGSAIVGMLVLAVVTGLIESSMARLPLLRITQLLIAAIVLSGVALALVQR